MEEKIKAYTYKNQSSLPADIYLISSMTLVDPEDENTWELESLLLAVSPRENRHTSLKTSVNLNSTTEDNSLQGEVERILYADGCCLISEYLKSNELPFLNDGELREVKDWQGLLEKIWKYGRAKEEIKKIKEITRANPLKLKLREITKTEPLITITRKRATLTVS